MMRNHVVPTLSRPRALLRAAVLFAVSWAVMGIGTAHADPRSVTVMTQNLYQGTEFAHIEGLVGKPGVTLPEVLAATTADYATYEHTHFKERAKQIAAEIARNQPDLVGLQEVATWHKGTFNPLSPFALPEPVSEDFTKELLAAIAVDGIHYEVVSRHDNNFTLAFPIVVNAEPFPKNLEAVGMVESGEILARSDLPPGQLKLSNPQQGVYKYKVEFENPYTHEEIPFTNSWQSIDAKVRGKTFRFITTHLDALAPGGVISGPQAKELLAGPVAGTSLPVILAGDMNSGLTSAPAAYEAFVKGGLTDTWTAAGLGAPPLTCCHLGKEDLVNEPSSVYTEDLDHVFTRGGLSVLNEHLVGNTVPSPPPVPFIWPSDHAGMVATLAVAP
jgi:endonuclease/exonuclease/phosphatase family metal-dependent hydrolase